MGTQTFTNNGSEIIKTAGVQATASWQTRYFWQKLFIYFWFSSLIGHYVELFGAKFYQIASGDQWQPIMPTVLPLAPPYGFGVAAIILFVIPLLKRYKLHPAIIFVLAACVVSVVEFICAFVIVLIAGHNQFWDYSQEPFNINGYISLESSLTFGALATIFIYALYPLGEKIFRRLPQRIFTILFWVLVIAYGADLLFLYLK